jgi:hypothetical protein
VTEPNRREVGRHRLTGEALRRAVLARLSTVALVVGTLVVGSVLLPLKPHGIAFQRPFVRGGVMGKPVEARLFRVTVLDATGGAQLKSDPPIDTPGVWIVVRVRAVALTEPVAIGYAALRDDRGRIFHASQKIDQPLIGGRTLQPGVPVEGEVVFEVPRDAVGHVSAQFAQHSQLTLDAVAEVPLPIGKTDVDGWLAEKKVVTVLKTKTVT